MKKTFITPKDTEILDVYIDVKVSQDLYNTKVNLLEDFSEAEIIDDTYKNILSTEDKYILTNDKYVVKIYFHCIEGDAESPVNEAFVGTFGVNHLNNSNFAKIKKVELDTVYLNRNCDIIYYENIIGIHYSRFILSSTYSKNITMFKQILLSLYDAYIKYDFTHYDLHLNNIIIKKLKTFTEIKSSYQNIDIYLLVDSIPVFIDYEYSHIKHNGQNLGRHTPECNVYNKSFWIHDIFKLLMYLYKATSLEVNTNYYDNNIIDLEKDLIVYSGNINYTRIIKKTIKKIQNNKSKKQIFIDNYNSNLYKLNDTISQYLSFFIGENMTLELYNKFYDINEFFILNDESLFDFKFEDFIKFVLEH